MADTKKVLLFVVEGPTDETAFALLFERVFKDEAVRFDIVGGDITTQDLWRGTPRNRLRKQVKEHVDRQPYKWGDLARVVQIVDADGAFVPDGSIMPAPCGELRYKINHIEAPNVEAIKKRNAGKRQALAELRHMSHLTVGGKSVPYEVYYLSRNLEHALHGIIDRVDEGEKERLAQRFRKRYKDDIDGFKAFLRDPELVVQGNYSETWDYIAEGTHSLERCSNLHLVIEE